MTLGKAEKMSKALGITIAALFALLLAGGIYAFLETHEKKQKTINTGLFGEARKNPLYASRVFLKRMGIPTETKTSIQGFNGYPNSNTVIVINSKRTTLSITQTQALIDWVKRGGHVIALATNNWKFHRSNQRSSENSYAVDSFNNFQSSTIDSRLIDHKYSPDPLQNYMGISTAKKIQYSDLSSDEKKQLNIIEEKDPEDDSTDDLFKIKLSDTPKQLAIHNNWFHPLIIAQTYKDRTEIIQLRSSNFIARQKVGSGIITLVSSLDFIENKQLEKADHAEVFWHLIHGIGKPIEQPAQVWLIHNDKIPSLWELIWRNAWMLLSSLLILFMAWLLLTTRRFGPAIPKLSEDRRSLTEHINSSGTFYWKHDQKQQLLDSCRNAINQKLNLSHPNWNHLNQEQQVALLLTKLHIEKPINHEKSSRINPQDIHHALFTPSIEQADDFTNTIRLLERIRTAK